MSKKLPKSRRLCCEVKPHAGGFVLVDDGIHQSKGPLHFADAATQLRFRQLETHPALQGAGFADLRKQLSDRAKGLASRVVKPALNHVRKVAGLLQGMREKHSGLAAEDRRHAAVSQDVYKPPNERREEGYVPELSGEEHAVYLRKGKAPLMVFRGTKTTGDVATDAKLALGKLGETDRWKRTQAAIERVKKIHPKLEFTGHSLGGTLALKAGELTGERSVGFNPGVGLRGVEGAPDGRIYSIHGDAVSSLGMLSHKDVRVLNSPLGPDALRHGIDNFTTRKSHTRRI